MSYYSGDFYSGDPGFFSFLGKIGSGIASVFPGGSKVASMVRLGGKVGSAATSATSMLRGGARGAAKHPVLSAAGAAGAVGMMGAGASVMGRKGARVPGMRRHHRMRVTNPKALRRAIRRTQGFAKLAMRTIHLVHPKKKARFGGFKRRARKAA